MLRQSLGLQKCQEIVLKCLKTHETLKQHDTPHQASVLQPTKGVVSCKSSLARAEKRSADCAVEDWPTTAELALLDVNSIHIGARTSWDHVREIAHYAQAKSNTLGILSTTWTEQLNSKKNFSMCLTFCLQDQPLNNTAHSGHGFVKESSAKIQFKNSLISTGVRLRQQLIDSITIPIIWIQRLYNSTCRQASLASLPLPSLIS